MKRDDGEPDYLRIMRESLAEQLARQLDAAKRNLDDIDPPRRSSRYRSAP